MHKLYSAAFQRILKRLNVESISPTTVKEVLSHNKVREVEDFVYHRVAREEFRGLIKTPCPITALDAQHAQTIIEVSKRMRATFSVDEQKNCNKCQFKDSCSESGKRGQSRTSNSMQDILIFMEALNDLSLAQNFVEYRTWKSGYKSCASVEATLDDLMHNNGKETYEFEKIRLQHLEQKKEEEQQAASFTKNLKRFNIESGEEVVRKEKREKKEKRKVIEVEEDQSEQVEQIDNIFDGESEYLRGMKGDGRGNAKGRDNFRSRIGDNEHQDNRPRQRGGQEGERSRPEYKGRDEWDRGKRMGKGGRENSERRYEGSDKYGGDKYGEGNRRNYGDNQNRRNYGDNQNRRNYGDNQNRDRNEKSSRGYGEDRYRNRESAEGVRNNYERRDYGNKGIQYEKRDYGERKPNSYQRREPNNYQRREPNSYQRRDSGRNKDGERYSHNRTGGERESRLDEKFERAGKRYQSSSIYEKWEGGEKVREMPATMREPVEEMVSKIESSSRSAEGRGRRVKK